MSRLLCCVCARADMGAALSLPHEGDASTGAGAGAPPTMADVIRERKKKAGGAALGTLRRRLAAAARRPRDHRPDRGCEHARFIRGVVSSWRLAEVFLLSAQLEAGAALRDLATQAELAREPARALHADLARVYRERWGCDVELLGGGWVLPAHRAVLHARCAYFRELLQRHPAAAWRVPLDGAAAKLSRDQLEAAVLALYAGAAAATATATTRRHCTKWERGANADGDLDIINVDNSTTCGRGCGCGCGRGAGAVDAGTLRRLAALLGFSLDSLQQDMRYLLDSGELADGRLEFRLFGGCGAAYGFRTALALPCHRLLLAARSRYFRSVMSRRAGAGAGVGAGVGAGAGAGGVVAVCVDECVLPRRFAAALLHAAYTDQVDLSLIGRSSSSPSSTHSGGSGGTAWAGVGRGGGGGGARPLSTAMLDDAFQLYEIARFLEMPIVVQGCEDAIVEALSPETLPHVLRWAAAPHASHWVHRQAMRYLRDEFPTIMSHAACGKVPRSALAEALGSPFLQCSESQALRALLRWGSDQPADRREPNVVWHTAHSVSRRGGRRRELSDALLRDTLASLVALVRTEHLPPDTELLHQLVRRGVVPAAEGGGAAAWLARGNYRPPRCFLPYLDEIKALLEDQAVPAAELARARRERYLQRIPDTLYMVAAARAGAAEPAPAGAGAACARACVSPRVLHALARRARELRAAPPAQRALQLHDTDTAAVYKQIALRAVREMSLPDACADLLLADLDRDHDHEHDQEHEHDRERETEDWESSSGERERASDRELEHEHEHERERWPDELSAADCCRALGGGGGGGGALGAARCASSGSLRAPPHHATLEGARAGTWRREPRPTAALHRQSLGGAGAGAGAGGAGGRLSACVPDVAMAPNANTHLLTARDYFRHAPPWDYSSGGVLQLDLGDGATHTPRPGSRAQRAGSAGSAHAGRPQRDHAQAMSCLRVRADEDELRAALELSVIRAYSSLGGRGSATLPLAPRAARPAPPPAPAAPPAPAQHTLAGRSRSSASPSSSSVGGRRTQPHTPPPPLPAPHLALSRPGAASRPAAAAGAGAGSASRSPSPRASPSPRRYDLCLYRPDQYRLEPGAGYGSSGSGSRGHSPNNYA